MAAPFLYVPQELKGSIRGKNSWHYGFHVMFTTIFTSKVTQSRAVVHHSHICDLPTVEVSLVYHIELIGEQPMAVFFSTLWEFS